MTHPNIAPDTKAGEPMSLRTRMIWLHSWVGYLAGLLLVCIFITGTLAVFDTEITRWMQPEMTLGSPASPSPQALDKAATLMAEVEKTGVRGLIALPNARDPALRVLHLDNDVFVGPALDPVSGAVIPTRDTVGGTLFFRFHYTLHLGHMSGVIIVQCLAIGLLVTIGAGLVIHFRALLPDLVKFRPRAPRNRAWLDAHLVSAGLFLPFMIMAPYTGIMIHADRFFPGGGGPHRERGGEGHGAHARPSPMPLAAILDQAAAEFGRDHLGFITINKGQISVFRADDASLAITRDHMDFGRATGELQGVKRETSGPMKTRQVMSGLHMARWAPVSVRWLYFSSGLAGAIMMASGLVLFMMKRRRSAAGHHPVALPLAEAATLGTIIGLPLACAAVFWVSRLVPATMAGRTNIETDTLFAVWLATLLFAAARAFRGESLRCWRELAAVLAAALCLLPLLDLATRWPWIGAQPWDAQIVYAAVDATAMALGLCAGVAWRKLRREPVSLSRVGAALPAGGR